MMVMAKVIIKALALAASLAAPATADVVGASFDTNTGQKDFGDRRGDIKFVHITLRHKGKVWFMRAGIETPQKSLSGAQFDTGVLSLYGGREYKNISFYLGLDVYNGKVLDAAQVTVRFLHSLSGRGTRTSPPSSRFKITPVAIGRFDESFALSKWLSLHGVLVGKASIGSNYAGAGGFMRLGRGSEWSPNVYGLPSMALGSSGLYVGVSARHVFNEVQTNIVGTGSFRIAAYAGAVLKISRSVAVSASFTKFFGSTVETPQLISGTTRPIEEINLSLSMGF